MTKRNIKVIGCGGIGSYLIDPLCRYVNYHAELRENVEMTLMDGDEYEDRNRQRQIFNDYGNKAEATVKRLQDEFLGITFESVGEYLTKTNIKANIKEGDIVFLCVDNHATRKLVSDHCQKLNNVLLISGGNDYWDGNVLVHVRENGKNVTPPIESRHPEIADPNHPQHGKNPGDEKKKKLGCQEMAKVEPQLVAANLMASAIMNCAFVSHMEKKLTEKPSEGEVYFDVLKMKVRPQ